MPRATVLDSSARRSPSDLRINMLTMHVHMAFRLNESNKPIPQSYKNEFTKFLQCIDEAIALIEYYQNRRDGRPASREGLCRAGSTEEARIHSILGAARKFYGEHLANDELKKLSSYLRRYGFARTHRSTQYERAKAFVDYLTEYDARFKR